MRNRAVRHVVTVVALTAISLTAAPSGATTVHTRPPMPPRAALAPAAATTTPAWAKQLPDSTRQVVRTVSSDFWCRRVYCTVTQAWQRQRGVWHIVKHFRSTIGARGWGKKREGDMRSPDGVRRIKVTFSTGRQAPGAMPWKRRLPTSSVSARPGRLYNTWIEERGRTDGNRPSMRFGFVVDYNRVRLRPYVGPKPRAGKGSGIFYHTSRPGHRWAPTLGCTQIGNVRNMKWLVEWLRPGAHPRVVQNL